MESLYKKYQQPRQNTFIINISFMNNMFRKGTNNKSLNLLSYYQISILLKDGSKKNQRLSYLELRSPILSSANIEKYYDLDSYQKQLKKNSKIPEQIMVHQHNLNNSEQNSQSNQQKESPLFSAQLLTQAQQMAPLPKQILQNALITQETKLNVVKQHYGLLRHLVTKKIQKKDSNKKKKQNNKIKGGSITQPTSIADKKLIIQLYFEVKKQNRGVGKISQVAARFKEKRKYTISLLNVRNIILEFQQYKKSKIIQYHRQRRLKQGVEVDNHKKKEVQNEKLQK